MSEPRMTGEPGKISLPVLNQPSSRRVALKAAGAALGLAAFGKAISPLYTIPENVSLDEFLQRHYKELNDEDKQRVFAAGSGNPPAIWCRSDDLRSAAHSRSQICLCDQSQQMQWHGKCMEACAKENNHHRGTNQSYIRVIEMSKGTMDMEQGSTTYEGVVPQEDKYYLPVQCQQCDNPPCVTVCPVEATWKEEDGIVVVDYNWCIGCRYCEAACPYHARRFNWETAALPPEEINPDQGYLSNRIRPRGTMEKCHFCLHRTREGRLPACLEACPTGARVFGDLNDPNSSIQWILKNKRVFVLKEDLGTRPSFFYFFD